MAERGGAAANAFSADSSLQSARNSWAFPSSVRPVAQHSFFPSGENTGSPSNPSVKVTRIGSCSPWASTTNNSKFSNPHLLEVNMTYLPDGW